MGALSGDFQRDRKPAGPVEYTVKNDSILFSGALCVTDTTSGELEAGTDAAGKKFAGVNYGPRVDNADDGLTCVVDRSQKFVVAGSGFTPGDVGKSLYLLTDNSAALSAGVTNHVYLGKFDAYISATECWCDPTRGDDDVMAASEVVADPASATSTNGYMTSIASSLASPPSITTSAASVLASTIFSATPTSAELATAMGLIAPLATDVRAIASVVASNVAVQALHLAEAEKAADDGRAALTGATNAINALQALGLFTAS